MKKTVAFVRYPMASGEFRSAGTVFLIGHEETSHTDDRLRLYAATAKHVIDGIRALGLDTVYLTYNGPSGRMETPIPISRWNFHPGRSVEYVDVVIARLDAPTKRANPAFRGPNGIRYWRTDALTTVTGSQQSLGTGHEIGITGLFVRHQGMEQNVPIVRSGNIAATPAAPGANAIKS
jgi:hypothetical protein